MSIGNCWADEEAWWTMGAAEARRRMHPSCLMVFPQGVMQGEAILAALDAAPRWQSVAMTDRRALETGDLVVLTYRADAERNGRPYSALCSSTWLRQDGDWRLVQHQQSPVG